MEHTLRCNSLKCRKELGDRALVTTCSHIFCTDCASRLGLTDPNGRHEHRNSCPACGSHLTKPDDAVIANLNPSEDYKTSVLSGLSPNAIIECASRAMSFWAYQTTQEVIYQEFVGKTLTEKYTNLSVHLDKVINDANSQITSLNNKINSQEVDQQNLRRKNDELAQAFKEKNKRFLQVQELYDKLKRKAMMGQMQDAAENAVDSSIHGAIGIGDSALDDDGLHSGIYQDPGNTYRQSHGFSNDMNRINNMYSGQAGQAPNQMHPIGWAKTMGGAQADVLATPSTHRQRLGDPAAISLSTVPGLVQGVRSPRHAMSTRAPLSSMPSNLGPAVKYPGVGLSSGLKVSHGGSYNNLTATSTKLQGMSRDTVRTPLPGALTLPTVVQRPSPTASALGRRDANYHAEPAIRNIQSASISGNMRSGFMSR